MPELVSHILEETKTSKQAVYKVIRGMQRDEEIMVFNKRVSFSLPYIAEKREEFEQIEAVCKADLFVSQDEKGKMRITFRTLAHCELVWTQMITHILSNVSSGTINYSLQPHYFYVYTRPQTNVYWEKEHRKRGVKQRFVCTHPYTLDKLLLKDLDTRLRSLSEHANGFNTLKQPSNVYYSVVGSYVCKVEFDETINKEFESLIKSQTSVSLSSEAQHRFIELSKKRGTFILTLERNDKKAKMMVSKVRKLFE